MTDARMTRFWITLQQGVDFVLKNFERMRGGEIFVPKIPSVRITDLATVMAPHLEQEIVGIRPGEKLHEVMCPADDSHLTLEFDDHYVLLPSINFHEQVQSYNMNLLGEAGFPVKEGFEYNSGTNPRFLTPPEIAIYNSLSRTNQSFTLEDVENGKFEDLSRGLV
ncbi:polysaccharide biosynthesis protein [Stappia sp. P2PMeth1]|uniref:polysaccharide biosynthesis protein n=1 Tax=Stappia sp. P2PMeth1 TaxID=2003586 RepID=UPI00210FA50F|nr:polysaccharide biosynthesis protein [Stappia sp. P2PMeth1]